NELNYECELVLRVCKNGKYINERNASNYYNGITVGIDFTARDLQNIAKEKGLPWEKAKAFDNSAAIGKFLDLTPDQKKANFTFKLLVNNQEMQRGNSADMVFKFDNLVAQISNYFSLNIGDIIFTGTPAGVGECVVGDELEAFLGNQSLLKLDIK
ncbi:MAG TPA: fumarylacetoacetate hydrolase family protein, partial [Ferruginibacter sp.]|nr:fumarylacetoacetate hydrolase family protein [Ferruginibacter sp.]